MKLCIGNLGKWNSVKWNETHRIGAILACFYVARVWQRQLDFLVFPQQQHCHLSNKYALVPGTAAVRRQWPAISKSLNSCYGSNTLIFRQYQGIEKRQRHPIFQLRVRRIRQILRFQSPPNNATVVEGKCFRQQLYWFPRAYRSTPQTTTQKSPAELLFGAPRSFHTRLPELIDERHASDEVRQTNKQNKQKMKQYADRRNHVSASQQNEPWLLRCVPSEGWALHSWDCWAESCFCSLIGKFITSDTSMTIDLVSKSG